MSLSGVWGEVTEGNHLEMLVHILEEKHQQHQPDKELRKEEARGMMEGLFSAMGRNGGHFDQGDPRESQA